MDLAADVGGLKGVGPKVLEKLQRLRINTVEDLLWHLPRRYEDFSNLTKAAEVQPGPVSLQGVITDITSRYVRRGLHITTATLRDDSGAVALTWFNQPYRAKAFKEGEQYLVSGEFVFKARKYQIMNPSVELHAEMTANTGRIIPVYRETKGLKSHQIRKIILSARTAIAAIAEELPDEVKKEHKLMPLPEAIWQVHFPTDSDSLQTARHRLAFDELFALLLANELSRKQHQSTKATALPIADDVIADYVKSLPFELTGAQKRAAWKCLLDIAETQPMNRLVEGDVGSGKTVVAAMAIVAAMANGTQSLVMAPTEILAKQHAESLSELLGTTGARLGLLVGSMTAKQKKTIKAAIEAGEIDVVIGTHALIEDTVQFELLGLAVIDEQHRFGVAQRQKLQQKAGAMPHLLSMTATPIPRSLALTVFGELDISVIDEMPPGRLKTESSLVSPNSRKAMYQKTHQELEKGKQVFVVLPLVEDSEKISAADATSMHKKLSQGQFKNYNVGLVHGRLPADEKDAVMQQFAEGKLDILVSTTVIEVGVNIPNATVMIIESAERFGLAQLHQLRGRVGRSDAQAYCFVVPSSSQSAQQRLKQFVNVSDGFELAEIDMEMRGPGEIYGAMQHGALDLRIAKLSDTKLISEVRDRVKQLVADDFVLSKYPALDRRIQTLRAMTSLN